ncbi:hypothetical protein A2154_00910 [Candidatus Gottesmanbacteria bacterium RBG_16_43_7]|uniref:HAD family hydrolase n=1 Tax=Candidatus Gottesmanbacteria bacterium RBG_16_43_7 TaxID=1798373 RepID=A0A1F5Z9B0_9BACT|nr:MAG: hypothetical protein A2154_00910 [Candidatus Gottesmanbacteria bacterium RBG_16_43_7]
MLKAIIYDIGGTLVKTDTAVIASLEYALKENGIFVFNKEKIINSLGKSSLYNITLAVKSSYNGDDVDSVIERVRKSYKKIFPQKMFTHGKIFPDVIESLSKLKKLGIKQAILTGFLNKEAELILTTLNLKSYFSVLVTVDQVHNLRPHPEALNLAIKKLGCLENECIYIGDTIADIQMAKNAHVKMICVQTGVQNNYLLKKKKPDYFLQGIPQATDLIIKQLSI